MNRNLFDKIIANVEQVFSVKFNKEQFFNVIQYHLTHLTNRMVMNHDMNDIFFEEIAEKYPSSYAMAEEAAKIIEKEISSGVPVVEINYLTLYFEMELSGYSVPNKRHIAVICHTGIGTALIIKNQLQKVIGHDVHITAYSQQVVSDETLDKYFAIFTTIPLRTINTKVPIIQLNSIINDDAFVREQWRKVEKYSQISGNKLKIRISNVSDNSNYLDLISSMSEELIIDNLVDENFKHNILEREKMKSTIFDSTINQSAREAVQTMLTTVIPFMAFVSLIIGLIEGSGVGTIIANFMAPLAGNVFGLVIIGFICSIPFLSPLLGPGAVVSQIVGALIGVEIGKGNIPPQLALPALFAINTQNGCDFIPVALGLAEADSETVEVGVPAVLYSRFINGVPRVVVAWLASFGLYS